MKNLRLLWVDDEVDMLKPFIIFLNSKGYKVDTVSNGTDALSMIVTKKYDLILLDEMMPGMDGLTVLKEIKKINTFIPVVMVTKNEQEGIMEDAIASQIADYLIKPINPSQIILTIKKIFQSDEIKRNRIGREYAEFSRELNEILSEKPDFEKWKEIYKKITEWNIKIDELNEDSLKQTHFLENLNANHEFAKYVKNNYKNWLETDDNRPVLSYDIISRYLIPHLESSNKPVYFIILDCMRLDQFKVILPYLNELFDIEEKLYYSILPTATPYSRNSIFSGILPLEIEKSFPQFWADPFEEESSRNRNEHQLMEYHLADLGYENIQSLYIKIFNIDEGNYVLRKIPYWKNNPLIVLVYNFLDLLAHHRSKSTILQETIPDDSALRAFTKHWFLHSTFYETLKEIKKSGASVILTTDHGSIRVNRSLIIAGDKETTPTIRYKFGKNLKIQDKHSFFIKNPKEYGLPQKSIVDSYAIATEDYFFVYPNYFHQYHKQYSGTYQHGGISMEEMILPLVIATPKK